MAEGFCGLEPKQTGVPVPSLLNTILRLRMPDFEMLRSFRF